MIGKLSGIIDSFGEHHVVLDVQGVGYLVQASARTLGRIGGKGDPASLLIDTAVREDAITLYGFADPAEQQWFRLLTSVQGVGAKVGMAILSIAPPENIGLAIAAQDKAFISQADGVGPKLALRILTELKDKAASLQRGNTGKSVTYSKFVEDAEGPRGVEQDAVSALVNLGYGRSDAFSAVQRAKNSAGSGANDNLQDLIRRALKELSG